MTNTTTQSRGQVLNQIIDLIHEMDRHELIILNNEYCQSINASDDEIFENDETFLDMFFSDKPNSLAQCISYGDYRYSDDFVRFNGYGNLESFTYFDVDRLCELVDNIADYIIDNFQEFSQFDELDFQNIEE